MSLYPSLEELKVDQAIRAQSQRDRTLALKIQQEEMMAETVNSPPGYDSAVSYSKNGELTYPVVNEYMPFESEAEKTRQSIPTVSPYRSHVSQISYKPKRHYKKQGSLTSYRSQTSVGLRRAEIKHGIRPVILCKDAQGKLGIRIRSVYKGVFVSFVSKGSPAAMGGLRFGDQILQVDGETLAGYSTEKAMKMLKRADPTRVELAVRDRPFERTVTLQKDSSGHVGFVFKHGKIAALIKNSSAARNGLLVGEHLCEINGQCVVGMKDQNIEEIILNCGRCVTLTLMPAKVFQNVLKNMGSGLMKKQDHSIPEV